MREISQVAVIGLGYVGLPLAVALARHFPVTGFDIDRGRIAELQSGNDRTGEVASADLAGSALHLTDDVTELRGSAIAGKPAIFIVTVPTPVSSDHRPDLTAVLAATRTVGGILQPGDIVVYESTVYPGVTENICGPELEDESGLVAGQDFFLGYSPERINPGDREHTVERITKVVAGQTPEVLDTLAALYGAVNGGQIFRARDIPTAEAAKVIENAQRDINIAFVNEVAMILGRMGVNIQDVLDAANTKWNFLNFRPGLVGGHCIGVDPYYLAYAAQAVGHEPEIILAGRRINDSMGAYVAAGIDAALGGQRGKNKGRALVLGLTFKENVPDLRNSKVVDIVAGLRARGYAVDVHDPHADTGEARQIYDIELLTDLDAMAGYDAVVGAVQHAEYAQFSAGELAQLVAVDGVVADIKGMWRSLVLPEGIRRWQL